MGSMRSGIGKIERDGKLLDLKTNDRDPYLVCGMLNFGLFERSWLLMGKELHRTRYGLKYEAKSMA
ncbi:hypothetical protein FACS189447_04520 [Spirochaetia bacterium]|nr:hypothetical protein FACS189447_04520 [Spirochaetia bacterium]